MAAPHEDHNEDERGDRPDLFNRFLARAVDLVLAFALCVLVPPAGTLLGILYLAMSDGLFDGTSAGKRLTRLRVVHRITFAPCTFKESVLRNLPFSVPAMFLLLPPPVGAVLTTIVGLPLVALEIYLLYTDPEGYRLGDILADTTVVAPLPPKQEEPVTSSALRNMRRHTAAEPS